MSEVHAAPSASSCPRLVIAGAASGVGKTTFTAALARALRARGLTVQTFKCGPDYLDPTYHREASGRPCHNLDPWMMGEDAVRTTFALATADADIALIEGVMGLFDGRDPESDESSTAHVAKLLDAPVLLVADASGMARSFAALVHGYRSFDPALRVVAALANRVGSVGHGALLARAMPPDLAFFALTREPALSFPERHLGLARATEDTHTRLDAWAARLSREIDIDKVRALASAPQSAVVPAPAALPRRSSTRCRIGVAHDAAFHFYYPFNLHLLESEGAELVYFSPLSGAPLPEVDGVYVGGGYPEMHAAALSGATRVAEGMHALARLNRPIYAECGGLMWLCRTLRTLDGQVHPMLGLIDADVTMHEKRKALGYTDVETLRESVLGPSGLRLFGHEFRYSELSPRGAFEPTYNLPGKRGSAARPEGYGAGRLLASYVHLHWGRMPRVAADFVEACCTP